ncbi:MAG: NAD-dependent epimerase/dehydratase family protein [Pseudomonas profundi]|uniref:NAD-dependent epimerase/dehydratase family protein n=1 Tax=Pseudomonas profundi TaxID=1981513 RepID=UPI003002435B
MKVLITGASGFIGSAVCSSVGKIEGFEAIALIRDGAVASQSVSASVERKVIRWPSPLVHIDCIIHCAGRAHVMRESSQNPLTEFRKVNLSWTLELANSAAKAGVKRFVFLSSIGVNGSATHSEAFVEDSLPAPAADYALSKLEAEEALLALQAETSMEIVIIRPPLVYAANAPGNFQRLLRLVNSRMPLPLSGVKNQRSMVALENLVDFIIRCIDHPAAANQIFLIADDEDLSTEEIVRNLATGMGLPKALLFPYPGRLLRFAARIAGKQGLYSQLYGSLMVDASKARRLLGWQPRLSAQAALQKAGREYKQALKSPAV